MEEERRWEPWGAGGMSLPPVFTGLQPGGVFLQIFAELPSAFLELTHIAYCPAPVFPVVFLWKFYKALLIHLYVFCLFCSSFWNILDIQ